LDDVRNVENEFGCGALCWPRELVNPKLRIKPSETSQGFRHGPRRLRLA
jgi:hypothetical protein